MQQQRADEFDERVKMILEGLSSGKTREAMAKELSHANYKTIDMYMRRRNFIWDSINNTYIHKNTDIKEYARSYESENVLSKAEYIISHIGKGNADVRTVAKEMGFSDHREMASYMRSKGYMWDMDKNNYVPGKSGLAEERTANNCEILSCNEGANRDSDSHDDTLEINKYIPILEMLIRNKDRLLDILVDEGESEEPRIPRYIIPGVFTTKSVHMVSQLDNMVKEFSKEKNISQREIFEVALIQFFKRYGYERKAKELTGGQA